MLSCQCVCPTTKLNVKHPESLSLPAEGSGQASETLLETLEAYQLIYMPSRNFAAKTRVNYRSDVSDLIVFLKTSGRSRLARFSSRR